MILAETTVCLAEKDRTTKGPGLRCQGNSKGPRQCGTLSPGKTVCALHLLSCKHRQARDQPSDLPNEVKARQTQVHEGCSGIVQNLWES